MKKFLATVFLIIHAHSSLCSSFELEAKIAQERDRKRDVVIKIFSIYGGKNPINLPIKEYIGRYFFGDHWKHFRYPIGYTKKMPADEAIMRNAIVAELEQKCLAEGRFDVYTFMIKNTDKTRFE